MAALKKSIEKPGAKAAGGGEESRAAQEGARPEEGAATCAQAGLRRGGA